MVKTMILEKLLENIDYQLIQGDLKQNVSQIDYDSRQVINESLFVCLPGSKVDGHHYAKNAVLSGAKVIVIEKKWIIKKA